MAAIQTIDQEVLQKFLLGQLPTAEVERLATEYADDRRLAELAESVAGKDDALLALLHNHETADVDPEGERLVERLLERLKPALPIKPRDDTVAMRNADASTEPSSPDASGPTPPLPERLEHYRPIKVLGQGGMGTVYLAEDTRLGREVAIKTLRPELAINPQAKERFLREARTAAKLEHDNVIPIYSVGEADGTPFLAMPLLKGEPLDALIRRTGGPLPVAAVVRLAREIASGLAAAHARGLIHRDIKPANIWLEAPTGRVKILDFGLAKAAGATSDLGAETHLTTSGAIVGTPAYMAPEQASGNTVDGRADLFSLGCVMYELLTDKRAFSGPNTMSILMSLANHTPAAPDKLSDQCPAALSRLVMQLLEKDPAQRLASADAVIQSLAELDLESTTASRAASVSGQSTNATVVRGLTPTDSSTVVEHTQADMPRLGEGDSTMPSTAIVPTRPPTPPKARVAFAAAGALLMLLAAVIYRIQTDEGTFVVTIEDPTVQAILEQDGMVIRDKQSGRTWTIKAAETKTLPSGEYQLKPGERLLVTDDSGVELKTDTFTVKRKNEFRVRVTLDQKARISTSEAAVSDDQRVAEWALSKGSALTIEVAGEFTVVREANELPKRPFTCSRIGFGPNQVTDSDLDRFKGIRRLEGLALRENPITDAGLAKLAHLTALTGIDLTDTAVTDAGMATLARFPNLAHVAVQSTGSDRAKVSDTGLQRLATQKGLISLDLGGSNVSDKGLEFLTSLKKLERVTLGSTAITDEGLKHLQRIPSLRVIEFGGTQVTDQGIAALRGLSLWELGANNCPRLTDASCHALEEMKSLRVLNLSLTAISDLGLSKLAPLGNLERLGLAKTRVTLAGVDGLSKVLPRCRIEWDGGVIEPTVSPDHRAAEYVLSIGGAAHIKENGRERWVKAIGDLPRNAVELTGVELAANPQVSDAGLAHFQNCNNLTQLDLHNSSITDLGLVHFKNCRNLELIALFNTPVTDVGIAHFKDLQHLTYLNLNNTKVSDEGLAHFKDCKTLSILNLGNTRVSDTGLSFFQQSKNLTILHLTNTQMTDAGLTHFRNCQNLTTLDLRGTIVSDASLEQLVNYSKLGLLQITKTKVTEAGVKKLAAALPGCKIEWDGGVIEPTVVTDPDRRAAEWVLAMGGSVVLDRTGNIKAPADLPKEPFRLIVVYLFGDKVDDEGLANLRGCEQLSSIFLSGKAITDAGLDRLKDVPGIRELSLNRTAVTNAGLARLKHFPNLGGLGLESTAITDAGLIHLNDLKALGALNLGATTVTGDGLAQLKDPKKFTRLFLADIKLSEAGWNWLAECTNVGELNLVGTNLTDAELARLKGLTKLVWLALDRTKVTDNGLSYLKDAQDLAKLNLSGTQIGDAGLLHVAQFKKLEQVWLQGTKVTKDGVEKLAAALPLCMIHWDAGVIEPKQ